MANCPECKAPTSHHELDCYHADCDSDDWAVHGCGPDWVDKHSVNCYYCGELVDERNCVPNTAEHGGNDDGGSICPECQANCPVLTKTEED